jgi:hypothetical protein
MKLVKCIFGTFFLSPLFCYATQTDFERALSIELTKATLEINAQSPQLLDEETRLDSAATFKNYVIYNNTMVNYTAEQLDVKIFDPLIEEAVIGPLCANKGLASFVELGVVMVYRYHGKDGQFITELAKDMSSCKNTTQE